MRPEAALERALLLRLGAMQGVLVLKNEVGTGIRAAIFPELCERCKAVSRKHRISYGAGGVGAPDLIGCVDGLFCSFELKSAHGKLRPEQISWRNAAAARGAICLTIRSVEDGVAAIEGIKKIAAGKK